ncbi:MAG TPA: peptidyl-prolyl cis-trans isomerase, partial [Prosthecobacter sp.]|nr:peptidyl-prolyl cis-trans isomerase [Prosthecobacter sp.]
ELISKNYVPSPLAVEKEYALQYQTLKISTIPFLLETFKKDVKITDEEIQKYFDETKETHKTAERRAVSYVFFEDPKDLDKKPLEERQKLEKESLAKVNSFANLTVAPDADLIKIAADQKVPVQTLPLFPRAEAPEAIKGERELIEAIFRFNKDTRTISDVIKTSKGFYIFTVTQIDEPKQQELSAVKEKIKETLTAQKAQEAMSKAVSDAQKALSEGLKEGKKIEDLAKEQKVTLTPMKDFDVSLPPPDVPDAHEVAEQAKETPPGQLTAPIEGAAGTTLVYVHAKELRKRDDSAALRKSMEESLASKDRDRIFGAWFQRKRAAAGLKLNL